MEKKSEFSVWLSLSKSVPAALPPGEFLREILTKNSDCFLFFCFLVEWNRKGSTTFSSPVSPIAVSVSKTLWQTKPLYHSTAWIGVCSPSPTSSWHFYQSLTLERPPLAAGLILIILASPHSFFLLVSLLFFLVLQKSLITFSLISSALHPFTLFLL